MIRRVSALVPAWLTGTLVLAVKLVARVTVTRRTMMPAPTRVATTCRGRRRRLVRRGTCFDLPGAMLLTVALGPESRTVPCAPGRTMGVGDSADLRGGLIDVPTGLVVDLVSSLSVPHLVEDGALQIVG